MRMVIFAVLVIFAAFSVNGGGIKKWNLDNYQHRLQHRRITGSNAMFISLFEHENYRGEVHRQTIAKECRNVPQEFNNWASSILLHDHCVILCDLEDCQGQCVQFYPNDQGKKRLSQSGLNDKVSSVKYCYQF